MNASRHIVQPWLEDGLAHALEIEDLHRALSRDGVVVRGKSSISSRPAGRDQTPLDITQKSLYGRCEEMQILFVAAARTVGLPSRAASTPWWAHMDNKSRLGGGISRWTGGFTPVIWDAAYFPNQTWFSGHGG